MARLELPIEREEERRRRGEVELESVRGPAAERLDLLVEEPRVVRVLGGAFAEAMTLDPGCIET